MGFDFHDILLNTERSFGIAISFQDPELPEALRTVGSFYDLILKRLDGEKSRGEVAPLANDALRHALAAVTSVEIDTIEPSTPLFKLLPIYRGRAAWKRLEENLGLRLPLLEMPDGDSLLMFLATLIVGIVSLAGAGIPSGLFVVAVELIIMFWLTKPFKVCFPSR
jgi:hypothetical protein